MNLNSKGRLQLSVSNHNKAMKEERLLTTWSFKGDTSYGQQHLNNHITNKIVKVALLPCMDIVIIFRQSSRFGKETATVFYTFCYFYFWPQSEVSFLSSIAFKRHSCGPNLPYFEITQQVLVMMYLLIVSHSN